MNLASGNYPHILFQLHPVVMVH